MPTEVLVVLSIYWIALSGLSVWLLLQRLNIEKQLKELV